MSGRLSGFDVTTSRSTAFSFSDSERPTTGVGSATTRVDVKRIAVMNEERMIMRMLQVIALVNQK